MAGKRSRSCGRGPLSIKDALRTERSDPHLAEARKHLHLDLLDIPDRVSAFVGADAQTRVIAGAFGLLVASTNPETGAISGVDSESVGAFMRTVLLILFIVAAVMLLVGLTMWTWQRDNDRARAVRVAWLRLYESALAPGDLTVRRGGVIQRVLAALRGVAT